MYRIIGIFEDEDGDEHLKLIKKEALNTAYAWNANNKTNINWGDSDIYKGLNGGYFLNNSEYTYLQDVSWDNLIDTWDYTATNNRETLKTGWIYLNNNDANSPSAKEWIMSRYGVYDDGKYGVWLIDGDGHFGNDYPSATNISSRPVFYLIETTKLSGGNGSLENPYMVEKS